MMAIALCAGTALTTGSPLAGQSSAIQSLAMRDGPLIAPVFEGWYKTPDGKIQLSFGYYNRSTVEAIELPIGPNNKIEPGGPDHGQPTHFRPRPATERGGNRLRGVFTITVPADAEKKEYVWTLTHAGRTLTVPSNIDPQFEIDALKEGKDLSFEDGGVPSDNTPPVLKFAADAAGGIGHLGVRTTLKTTLPEPATINFWVTDDGKPVRNNKPVGVTVAWSKYRGPGAVTFSRLSVPIDAATGSGSVSATFSEPGDYVLWGLATDGSPGTSECCWTNGFVTVLVGGKAPR